MIVSWQEQHFLSSNVACSSDETLYAPTVSDMTYSYKRHPSQVFVLAVLLVVWTELPGTEVPRVWHVRTCMVIGLSNST